MLPTKIVKARSVNPSTMLIYSAPKIGKSSILSQITQNEPNSLIISTEPTGYDFLDAIVTEALTPKDFRNTLAEVKTRVEEQGKYKYLIIDTITKLDEWSELIGTWNYMATAQGKKFNRVDGVPNGVKIPSTSNQFQTVHDIGQGYGYKHSRKVMIDWYDEIITYADHVILVAHVKDKLVSSNLGEQITALTINLTGRVKDIYCARVSAIAMLVAGKKEDTNKRYLNFQAKDDSKFMGSRAKHLKGKILVSEEVEDEIVTYWENIYK